MMHCYVCARAMLTTTTQCGSVLVQCTHCVGRLYSAARSPLTQINIILHTASTTNDKSSKGGEHDE